MKNNFKTNWFGRSALIVAFALMLSLSAQAQMQGMAAPKGSMVKAMMKIYGDIPGFTARAEREVTTAMGPMTVVSTMSMLDGKIREETDLADVKSAMLPPTVIEQMKKAGISKSIQIVRPDKNAIYVVSPGAKSYLEMAFAKSTAKEQKELAVEKTEMGKETIDGHACTRSKVVITDEDGEKHEMTIWNATDLKNFPIKSEAQEQGSKVVSNFKDVKLTKPDAKQFEVPAEFTKYTDAMQYQMATMQQMQKAAAPPAK
jgi:hypothetical protein